MTFFVKNRVLIEKRDGSVFFVSKKGQKFGDFWSYRMFFAFTRPNLACFLTKRRIRPVFCGLREAPAQKKILAGGENFFFQRSALVRPFGGYTPDQRNQRFLTPFGGSRGARKVPPKVVFL